MTAKGFPTMTAIEKIGTVLLLTLPAIVGGPLAARPRTRSLLMPVTEPAKVALFDRIADRCQGRPVWGPGGVLYIVSKRDAHDLLASSALTFSPASPEKLRMLSGLQPDGLAISTGRIREDRRRLNEQVLSYHRPVPASADRLCRVVEEEITAMLAPALHGGGLRFPAFKRAFDRIGRRAIFGDAARDDLEIWRIFYALRRDANAFGLLPGARRRDQALRAELHARISAYARQAEPDALIAPLADLPEDDERRPLGQVPHWMLAIAILAQITTWTLALIGTHPRAAVRVREEIATAAAHHGPASAAATQAMPYLRACVIDAARLWPIVPNLPRIVTEPVDRDGARLPVGTRIMIPASYLSRSRTRGARADRFDPDGWLSGESDGDWALLPFSRGPASCPGSDLGVFLSQTACAAVLRQTELTVRHPRWSPTRPLPKFIETWKAEFTVAARPAPSPAHQPARDVEETA
jgi:cytochrome P450